MLIDENNRPYTNIRILHTLIIFDPFEDEFTDLKIPDSPPYVKVNFSLMLE